MNRRVLSRPKLSLIQPDAVNHKIAGSRTTGRYLFNCIDNHAGLLLVMLRCLRFNTAEISNLTKQPRSCAGSREAKKGCARKDRPQLQNQI